MQVKIRSLIAVVELTKDKVGLNTLKKLLKQAEKIGVEDAKMYDQLESGRNYLMQIESDTVKVSDVLEAFGFGKNGLK